MIYSFIQKRDGLKTRYARVMRKWGMKKIAPILSYLQKTDTILDIGSGNCMVTNLFREKGFDITAVDVADLSLIPDLHPVVYDGQKIPFDDDCFDVSMVLTVLHHCEDPIEVLKEACRVGKRTIIIEDTYKHRLQKWATQRMDYLVNGGHSAMTYQNKSHRQWMQTFEILGLKVTHFEHKRVLLFFQQTIYILDRIHEKEAV